MSRLEESREWVVQLLALMESRPELSVREALLLHGHPPDGIMMSLPRINGGKPFPSITETIMGVQPMTGQPPSGLFRFATPEEVGKRKAESFECVAWVPSSELEDQSSAWTKGRLSMSRRDDGKWMYSWWRDAPPLTRCTPDFVATAAMWCNSRPAMYAPLPEDTTMVTFILEAPSDAGIHVVEVFVIPVDREAELRAKVLLPQVP